MQEERVKMKNEPITRVSWDELDQMEDLTDWERVDKMTEEEIEQNALDDLDNPLLTNEQLKQFEPVHSLEDWLRSKGAIE